MKPNILIPMAGMGSRFADAGYDKPKPLIDIYGKPMIQRVVESLGIAGQYIFIVQSEHLKKYNLVDLLNNIVANPIIIEINELTDGAARTALLAKDIINNNTPLILANSDQIVEWDSVVFKTLIKKNHAIALFQNRQPKWSYAKITNGAISEVAEKKVISDNATVGIYGWKTGADYVKYAEQMIQKNIRTNNEFYICPVYNEAIQNGDLVIPYFVDKMYGVGTPEDLKKFVEEDYAIYK